MTENKTWPTPLWLEGMSPDDRERAELNYHLQLAATYATPDGTMSGLSVAIGLSKDAVPTAKHRGTISPEMAKAIERTLGVERFPAKLFCPLFADPE